MTSGLVHEIDAKVTARGRQKRVTFPHKLLVDYLAAWYICQQNIQDILLQSFPTLYDVKKHEELIRFCCGLMKGREEVMTYLVKVYKQARWGYSTRFYFSADFKCMESLQNECGVKYPHFVDYPSQGQSLSEVLSTAKIVKIGNLTNENYDPTLPCCADIFIIADRRWDSRVEMCGDMRTLQGHKEHISAIFLDGRPSDVMGQVSSLLPSSKLEYLRMQRCNSVPKAVVSSLAQMPQLTYLCLWRVRVSDGDVLVAAVKAWNGQSTLKVLNLFQTFLPASVCQPLLNAIAGNCPSFEVLFMNGNTLSGCLEGFLQNPPFEFRTLDVQETELQAEDIESLSAAVKAGKLENLGKLDIRNNKLSKDAITPLLKSLTTAVTAGKLQKLARLYLRDHDLSGCLTGFLKNPPPALNKFHLSRTNLQPEDIKGLATAVRDGKLQHLVVLDLGGNNLSEVALKPLLHALLNSLADRRLDLHLKEFCRNPITIAPNVHPSIDYYLPDIRKALSL